ncbi:hypothetical protein [Candidatus Deferrimicrobium sp.]|uniref:hypothetical protein n=1 Tax=Candidatus Deferrimicrobium sp. TaxID=3060586 RepID=UPI002721D8B5|nr:hypothetical protein [Candidatus Deferrimicrobium sp.]MDO8738415.1 hypothetical protein [Candidatus Deferrimicrobium sp.]
MSDPESLLKKIAEEEARLARVEKERDEVLARLKDLRDRLIGDLPVPTSPKPIPSKWLTLSESIRAASEIPFEVDLTDDDAVPAAIRAGASADLRSQYASPRKSAERRRATQS